jgi:hypothetical protein
MKPTFVLRFSHEELVVLMASLRFRFIYNESTRRSTTQRDLTAYDRPVGVDLLDRLTQRFNQEVDLFEESRQEDLHEEEPA